MRKDWEVKKFEECVVKTNPPKKIKSTEYLVEGLYPIISQDNNIISGYWNNINDVVSIDKPVIIFGDHTRVIKYVDYNFSVGADGVIILQPIKELISKYFYYCLKSSYIPSLGYSRHYKLLKELSIPVPPLQTQQQIVEELDCLSSIMEKQKKQLEELDNLAQSIFYDMFGDPIENEKGWNIKKLGDVCKTSSGGTPSKNVKEYFCGNTLWLRSGEIKKMYLYDTEIKISDSALNNSSAKIFPINTVVIAMYGATVGQVGILKKEMATNQAVCGIIANDKVISEIYLYYNLKEHRNVFLSAAIGGGQPNISQSIIRNTFITLPPLSLQQKFASKIEAIEKQKELIKKSIKETEDLFNSRMDYYFN